MPRRFMRSFFRIVAGAVLCVCAAAMARAESPEITFVSYNVENYIVMQRKGQMAPKPEAEKDAVVKIIASLKPDILGVCEMGDKEQFADFQKRLADAGLKFKDTEYVTGEGEDNVRHVALLSKFPIVSHQSVTDVAYTLNGHQIKVQRGFLDVTVQVAKGLGQAIKEFNKAKDELTSEINKPVAELTVQKPADQQEHKPAQQSAPTPEKTGV